MGSMGGDMGMTGIITLLGRIGGKSRCGGDIDITGIETLFGKMGN